MRVLITIFTALIFLSFQNCSEAIFSKSDASGGGSPEILVVDPIIPGFGDNLDCNSDFALSAETLAAVSCTDGDGTFGIYICRIPLDGQGQVTTLCMTPEAAAVEVSQACVCEDDEEEVEHGDGCHKRHSHIWDWLKRKKKRHHSSYSTSTYGYDDDSSSSDDDSSSSDDDSSSSDDDSSSSDDDDGGPALCVPSTTVQYRLGNCAELF